MCVRTQHSSEEAFRVFGRNLTILGRSLPICGRSLPICGKSLPVCGGDAPQTHFRKVFQIAASIFKDMYHKNSLGMRLERTIIIVNDGDLCYSPHPHHHVCHLGWWNLWNKADLWCGEVFREGEDEWEVYLRRGGTVMV